MKLTPWLAVPPGPVAVTVTLTGPTARPLRPHENVPLVEAVVVQRVVPLGPLMVTTLPGVAVPDTVGEVVVDTPTGSVTVRLGAPAAVKLVTSATLTPPALVATAVTEFTPTLALITQEYEPDAVAVVLHKVVLLAPVRVTILPGVAVPDTVGVKVVTTLRGLLIATVG
ncbi:hypothetical protein GCM10028817_27530 [Spirosoma pomorum]